ncbi:hypothetical protein [Sphingomonas sp. DC2300-3]|uniref:hypothetical protein n=1 Tax=unclassified Sphingomonas TaxID=196159 RepID=UPI003CE7E3A8
MGVWAVEEGIITAIDRALATIAILSAFALTPLLPFANPVAVAAGGCLFAVAAGLRFFGQQLPPRWSIASAVIGLVLFVIAGAILLPATSNAAAAAKANERRCLAIQKDMLSSLPLRANDADVFQALGCKPQGAGSVYADRPDDDLMSTLERGDRRRALPYRDPNAH